MSQENQLPQAVIESANRLSNTTLPQYERLNAYATVQQIRDYAARQLIEYDRERAAAERKTSRRGH